MFFSGLTRFFLCFFQIVQHLAYTLIHTVTCNHVVHSAHLEQHLLDEADLGAGLQVSHALAEDGGEHAPDLCLARHLAVGQQLHHAANALRLLDDEVHLQVKLAAHQLEEGKGEGGGVGGGGEVGGRQEGEGEAQFGRQDRAGSESVRMWRERTRGRR